MKYIESENKIVMTEYNSFDIEEILECGQCFRFDKLENKHYSIIAKRKKLYIHQTADKVEFYPCSLSEFENTWFNYFDLGRDYDNIKATLSKEDDVVKVAIEYASGIRILNQDIWECLISFIISQNNRIPIIKQVIKNICEKYGDPIGEDYAFPTWEQINATTIDDLMLCRTGFRAKYILDAAARIGSGKLKIDELPNLSSSEAKELLTEIHGVGPKVSDCVLLFACGFRDMFPTDVWVKRIMQQLYFGGDEVSLTAIHDFARVKYGENAGFAQQYLFHYARQKKIGV